MGGTAVDARNPNRKRPLKYKVWEESGVPWETAIAARDAARIQHKVPKVKLDLSLEFAKAIEQQIAQQTLRPKVLAPTHGCRARKPDNRMCGKRSIVRYTKWEPHPDTKMLVEIVTEFCQKHSDAKDRALRVTWEREIIVNS